MAAARVAFTIAGMHCANCGLLIDDVVEDLEGVTSSSTDVRRETTTVVFDPELVAPEMIVAAVADAGYRARQQEV